MKSLKSIGELQYNFETMTGKIAKARQSEFESIQHQIRQTLQNENVYEKECATKKMLLAQVNQLKNQCKMEIDSRRIADDEIAASLGQYQAIIEKEVAKQRAEVVRQQKNAPAPHSD